MRPVFYLCVLWLALYSPPAHPQLPTQTQTQTQTQNHARPCAITIQKTGVPFLRRLLLTQGAYRLEGRKGPVEYDFSDKYARVQHVVEGVILTQTGERYLVVKRKAASDQVTLEEYPYVSLPWRMALIYPTWMAQYSIRADFKRLILPTLPALNRILDDVTSQTYAVGPRFEEMDPGIDQRYTPDAFFNALVEGRVLMATQGDLAFHDLHQAHFIGNLMVPPAHFARLVNLARRVRALSQIPRLRQRFHSELQSARHAFCPFWDDFTGEMGFVFPTKTRSYVQSWNEEIPLRRALFRLLGGEPLTREDREHVQMIPDSLGSRMRRMDVLPKLLERAQHLHALDRRAIVESLREVAAQFPVPVLTSGHLERRFLDQLGRPEPDPGSLDSLQP